MRMVRSAYRNAIVAMGSAEQLILAQRRMPEGYAETDRMQVPESQATVSDPSGVSGKSPSDAHEGREPMMMTFAPTGTSS